MTFEKIGRPLPTLSRKRFPFTAKADPFKGKTTDFGAPSDDEKLELFALKSDTALGTLPERLVQVYLEYRDYMFVPQYSVSGAGARLDFLVVIGDPPGIALRVHGDYWHQLEGRIASDAAQYLRLMAMGFSVVTVWEGDVYSHVLSGDFFTWMDEEIFTVA